MTEEQLIKMAAQLYDMRDFCKRLNPGKYADRIAKLKHVITEIMRDSGMPAVKVVIDAMTEASKDNDHAAMAWIGAAFLELHVEANS